MEPSLPERRFRSAARYYLSGRPSYASLLIRRVVELCALNATHKLLDLGAERISIIERRLTAVEHFTDRALSFSSTSRERLADKADDLASEIQELMANFARDGVVAEVVESIALIARRRYPSY